MLKEKMAKHNATVWLVNTGWTGGPYGVGKRFSLKYTRAIIDAVLEGALDKVEYVTDPVFGLAMPKSCPGVPDTMLHPREGWADKAAYDATAHKLAGLFHDNFKKYASQASPELLAGGPLIK
jgi:phosphoenolpyruvate carboxykinase (ATP)